MHLTGSDFNAADGNSDDDDLFSLDDTSEVRDMREVWNAQTPISKPLSPKEIIPKTVQNQVILMN